MSTLTIEVLFPEVANLHGDLANVQYLGQCRPDASIIRTPLTETPAFLAGGVDLVYLGPLTESGQLAAVDSLRGHRDRISGLIDEGQVFLFTHNAVEVLGSRLRNDDMGYDVAGVGVFEIESTISMFGRYSGKVIGALPELGGEHPVVGYKSQFSMVSAGESVPGFLTADRGIGRNRSTPVEGVRINNFMGSSLIGPLLIVNPYLTQSLLARLDPDSEPKIAHETLALEAYRARVRDFGDDRRWNKSEQIVPEGH